MFRRVLATRPSISSLYERWLQQGGRSTAQGAGRLTLLLPLSESKDKFLINQQQQAQERHRRDQRAIQKRRLLREKEQRQQQKLEQKQQEKEQKNELYQAHNIKVLLSLKEYTELNKEKRKL